MRKRDLIGKAMSGKIDSEAMEKEYKEKGWSHSPCRINIDPQHSTIAGTIIVSN